MLGLGHGIHAETVGPAGIFRNNYSILLDGVNDYIAIDTVVDRVDTDKGTFSIWIKFNGATSINGIMIKSSVDSNNQLSIMYLNSSTKFRFQYKAGGTVKNVDVTTSEEIDGNWTHLAMTWDTGEDELKGYVNGSQVESTVSSLGTFSGTLDKSYMGANTLAANSYFKGYIDEASVFTEVVNIDHLYNGGNPKDVEFSSLPGLAGYWRFTEGTGTSIGDESGNSNTGTLTNGAAWSTETPESATE